MKDSFKFGVISLLTKHMNVIDSTINALNKNDAKEVNLRAPKVLANDMGNTSKKLNSIAHIASPNLF